MDDKLIIGAPDDIKQKAIALIALLPICFVDWIFMWVGWRAPDEPKTASIFMIGFWIVCLIVLAFEAYTQYRIDGHGVTRTIFKRFTTFFPWEEMKFIGDCIDTPDLPYRTGNSGNHVMLFSKVPYLEYRQFHIIIHRFLETRHVISIRYIDDETYEKILEFSGGERNME